MEIRASRDTADNSQDRPGKFRRHPMQQENHYQHPHRDGKGEEMNFTKMPNDCGQHERRAARGNVEPQHSRKHGNADLKSDSGEKTYEHRARKEIRDESDAQQTGEEEKYGGHQGDEAGKRDVTSVVPGGDG